MSPHDLPNLDFIRSVAVLSVVAEHILLALNIQQAGPFPIPYLGINGVLLFFVLTSLVLMWSLERKPHALNFYIRRIFRIYPLAIATLLLAVAFHAPVSGAPTQFFQYQHPSIRDFLLQAALLQNLQDTAHPVVTVMWSLPYEVQMYLFLPLLFFFVHRYTKLWPLLLLWVILVAVAFNVPSDYVNFPVVAPYFLPGLMAYVGFRNRKPVLPAWLLPPSLFVLWFGMLPHMNFHRGWWFCLFIGLSLPLFRQLRSPLVTGISAQIAKYSYGIYLMHPFAIVIGLYLLRGRSVVVQCLGVLVPLILLPVLAYQMIEHPMILLGGRLANRAESNSHDVLL